MEQDETSFFYGSQPSRENKRSGGDEEEGRERRGKKEG